MLDVLDEDYVRTAESKGLSSRVIRGRHILRNALLPVVTTIGLQIGGAARRRGAHRDGLQLRRHRQTLTIAFSGRDYSVLQVLILAAAVIYVVVNLLVDISYAVIDPSVRTR